VWDWIVSVIVAGGIIAIVFKYFKSEGKEELRGEQAQKTLDEVEDVKQANEKRARDSSAVITEQLREFEAPDDKQR